MNLIKAFTWLTLLLSSLAHASAISLGVGSVPTFNQDRSLLAFEGRVDSHEALTVKNVVLDQVVLTTDQITNVSKMSFSADSQRLAVISGKSELFVLDLKSGNILNQFDLSKEGFSFVNEALENAGIYSQRQSLEFSPDGKFLAIRLSSYSCTYPNPNRVVLIDLEKNAVYRRPSPLMTGDLKFSPDSHELYVYDICGAPLTMHSWSTSQPSQYSDLGNMGWGVQSAGVYDYGYHVLRLSEGSKWYLSRVGIYNVFDHEFDWISAEMAFGQKMVVASGEAKFLVGADSKLLYFANRSPKFLVPGALAGMTPIQCSEADFTASAGWRFAADTGRQLSSGKSYALVWDLGSAQIIKQVEITGVDLQRSTVIAMALSESERKLHIYWHQIDTDELSVMDESF